MVNLLFCGDFVSQSPDHIEVDTKLKELFSNQDFIAVNFEAPISGFGSPIKKSGPSLTQSPMTPVFLETIGVNVIQLANNHMMDQGEEGCRHTINAFTKSIIIGAGSFDEAYKLTVLQKNGIKIGLMCLTHKEFGVLDIDSNSKDYGTAWINHPIVNQRVIDAKKECDFLIVLPHTGVENILAPLPEWRSRYRELIDYGADAIIASHPHTPQGWETYKGKKIFYSLGNFYFELNKGKLGANWYKGLIVQITIKDKKEIEFDVINTFFSDKVLGIDNSEGARALNRKLCELVEVNEKYQDYINSTLLGLWPMYKLYLLRGLSAITPYANINTLFHSAYGLRKTSDIPLLINNFQCESHLWAIERILKNMLEDGATK